MIDNFLTLLSKVSCLLLLLSVFFLQSCMHLGSPDSLAPDLTGNFGSRPAVLSPEEIHQLTPAQIDDFLSYMNNPRYERVKRHRRLYNYLEKITRNFNYQSETLIAEQAINMTGGNCLSLAILTSALAKLVNLEMDFQLMDSTPIYALNGTVVSKVVHIRSVIYEPDWEPNPDAVISFRPSIKIDYFPTKNQRFITNMNEQEYLAMYYRNIAAEAIIEADYNTAYWHAIESLNFDFDNSSAINMLAIINQRVGDSEKAEHLYLYGIEHADEKLSLLKNYRVLLQSSGRINEAQRIETRLSFMVDGNPFNWFRLAQSSYDDGDFPQAIRFFNKTLELAPYLHEVHLGLALSYYEQGRLKRAESALQAALDNAYKASTRKLYQAKLTVLAAEAY